MEVDRIDHFLGNFRAEPQENAFEKNASEVSDIARRTDNSGPEEKVYRKREVAGNRVRLPDDSNNNQATQAQPRSSDFPSFS